MDPRRTARVRAARRRRAERLARRQAGVVSRPQLYADDVTRWEVRANLRAGRWRRTGSQSVAIRTGPLTQEAQWWAAVFEAGPRGFLDGASALQAAGLRRFETDRIGVSVPRGARVRRSRHVDIRQTRRWSEDDLDVGGIPRARPPVAAVRAALWARSDKQAALVLTMTVQQDVASAEEIAQELLRVRRDRRRALLHAMVLDLLGGVRALGELEVAQECRRRGLPEPTRQVMRRTRNGTFYLDVWWEEWQLVVEVDGIQHQWAEQVVGDALRQNELILAGARVLRLPLLGLRVSPEEFFVQVEHALRAAGWPGPSGRHTQRAS